MHYYKTTAIILKSESYRESDRIYTIYTKKYGKMRGVARGARKIKSKLASHLEPFNLANLTIVKGRITNKIINAVAIDSFSEIKNDLARIIQGSYILEVIDVLTKEHHQDERIFNLLLGALGSLRKAEDRKDGFSFANSRSKFIPLENPAFFWGGRDEYNPNLLAGFILHLLSLLGYKPELYLCVHCKKRIFSQYSSVSNFFSPKLGGLLCSQCKKFDQNSLPISEEGIEILRKILLDEKVNLTGEVEKIIDSFLKYRLEKELKSERSLQKYYETIQTIN
jgi:DNA repair protein RecO (recombination protein O)